MTDRIKCLTVALDHDYRDDDVETIVNAVMMIKGVQNVTKNKVDVADFSARVRVMSQLQTEILDVFNKNRKLD